MVVRTRHSTLNVIAKRGNDKMYSLPKAKSYPEKLS